MKLAEMTIEQLEGVQRDLHMDFKEIKMKKRMIAAILDQQRAHAEARRKWDAMSGAEKAAVTQIIGAKGIASSSAVGTPGGS
jgi:hypothetical protein